MTINCKVLNLVPGKLYKVIENIGCAGPIYEDIPCSTIVMLIEIKKIEHYPNCTNLVFLFGKQIVNANFSGDQFPEYLMKLEK